MKAGYSRHSLMQAFPNRHRRSSTVLAVTLTAGGAAKALVIRYDVDDAAETASGYTVGTIEVGSLDQTLGTGPTTFTVEINSTPFTVVADFSNGKVAPMPSAPSRSQITPEKRPASTSVPSPLPPNGAACRAPSLAPRADLEPSPGPRPRKEDPSSSHALPASASAFPCRGYCRSLVRL